MGQVVAVSLEVDGGESVREIQSIETALADIKKNTNINNVDSQFQKLNATIDQGGNSVEDLQRAIKSYQTIALTAGRESPVGKDAIMRASNLKDQITDLNNEVKRLANDHKNLQGAMEIGQGTIAGYQAFQGVTAMVGVENEELMKTMVKLQGAQSAMNGLMQIKTMMEKESNAMLLIQGVRTKVLTGLTIAYNTVMGISTGAMKLFKKALIATGLGALVVLIGTLVANWDEWKGSIMDFIDSALAPMMPLLQWLGIIESENDKIRREAHENRVAELEEEMELQKIKIKTVSSYYDHEIAKARAVGKETYELEKEKLKAVLGRAEKEGQAIVELYKLNRTLNEDQLARANELGEFLKKSKNDLEILELSHNHKIEEAGKKSYETRIKAHKDQINKEIKQEEEKVKGQLELQQKIEDFAVANIQNESVRKLAQLEVAQERERQNLIDKFGKETELMKELELNQANEMDALIAGIEESAKQKKIEDDAEEVARLAKLADDKTAIEEKAKNDKLDIENALMLAKQKNFDMSSSLAGNISKLFKEQSDASKAFAIAQVVNDTARAISSLVAMSNANPANAVTGGVAGFLQYSSGAIQIATNMKKVHSLLKSGSGINIPTTSSGGSSGGSTFTPRQNTGSSNTTGRSDTGSEQTYPTRITLVQSEVEAMRIRNAEIANIASI